MKQGKRNRSSIQNNKRIIVVFNLNQYPDGMGDIGNYIEVSSYMIEKAGSKIIPHFVIAGWGYQAALKKFKQSMERYLIPKEQIYVYSPPADWDPREGDQLYDGDAFVAYVKSNINLKKAYNEASIIFNISTPFFHNYPFWTQLLKKSTPQINITEHGASSYSAIYRYTPQPYRLITGLEKDQLGLMLKEQSNDPVQALLSITDQKYLKKLGLPNNFTEADAKHFLQENLVVPIYLRDSQCNVLPQLLWVLKRSTLCQNYKKVILHISRFYERGFNQYNELFINALESNGLEPISSEEDAKFITIKEYNLDIENYNRIYQLSSGHGVAFIAGDKSLEQAIQAGLLPIYVAPGFKHKTQEALIELVGANSELGKLFAFTIQEPSKINLSTLTGNYPDITPTMVNTWLPYKTKLVHEKSFWSVFDHHIITPILSSKKISSTIVLPIDLNNKNSSKPTDNITEIKDNILYLNNQSIIAIEQNRFISSKNFALLAGAATGVVEAIILYNMNVPIIAAIGLAATSVAIAKYALTCDCVSKNF